MSPSDLNNWNKNAKNASNDKLRANFNKDSDQFQRNMKWAQMMNKEQVSKPHDEKPN